MAQALILHQKEKEINVEFSDLDQSAFPAEDVLIEVSYSSLNYKDALAVTGKGKIVRGEFPFVPGIDLVGRVVSSKDPAFKEGDKVIGNGWGLGEAHWGGYAQMACVKSKSLIHLPDGMDEKHAMALGTAGFTAMLSVMMLEEHDVTPDKGEVVVTGATGGVGSIGIVLLSRLGYSVVASSGKTHAHDYLKELGSSRIIGRDVLGDGPRRALDKGLWAGAIDNVGGPALAALLSQMGRHGAVASCGLAHKAEFDTTVYPFILRGVALLGIDTSTCTHARRIAVWDRLTKDMPRDVLESLSTVIGLRDVLPTSNKMMDSNIQGRFIVDVNG